MTKQGKTMQAITADQVKEVARTGAPHPLLTVDQLVGMTSQKDWDGTLYELKGTAAYEIADTVNTNHGLEHQPAQVAHSDNKVLAAA